MFRSIFALSAFFPAKVRCYLLLGPLGAIAGGAVAVYRTADQQSSYSSSGRLVISGRLNFSEGNPVANDFMSVLGTQLEILTSEELRERAMIKLRLERPELTVRPNLSARQLSRTTIFELTATSGTAAPVQRYLDLAMEEYIAMRREQRLMSSRSVMDQISSEIARLEKILSEQETELFHFKQQRNIVFWEQQSTTAARFLSQLKNREASLRMQLKLAELLERGGVKDLAAHVAALQLADVSEATRVRMAGAPGASGALAAQKLRLREMELERETLGRVFLPKHPRYQKIEDEVAKVRRLVALLEQEDAATFQTEVAGLRSELETILASMDEWEKKVLESSQVEAEYQKLQSTTTRTRELYQRLVGSLQSIDFRKGVDDEVIQVLKRAGLATELKPDATASLRGGIGVGLLAGGGLIFLALRLDRRAFAVAEVTAALGVEVAMELPLLKQHARSPVALAEPTCPANFAEAIRSLRAALVTDAPVAGHGRLLVVCSSTPAEGKSTVSLNLAHSLAAAGLRVLLIDADLRRGTIGVRLGLPLTTPGLADILRTEGNWRDHVQPAKNYGFSVITCGTNSEAIVDKMVFRLSGTLLSGAQQEYDLVIIDSAPIMPVSDIIPFLAHADRVVFVVRLRTAMLTTARKAFEILKRTAQKEPLLIVNGTRPSDGQFDYYNYTSDRR